MEFKCDIRHMEQICGCQGRGGMGWWMGRLGLTDANYYT